MVSLGVYTYTYIIYFTSFSVCALSSLRNLAWFFVARFRFSVFFHYNLLVRDLVSHCFILPRLISFLFDHELRKTIQFSFPFPHPPTIFPVGCDQYRFIIFLLLLPRAPWRRAGKRHRWRAALRRRFPLAYSRRVKNSLLQPSPLRSAETGT